MPASAASIQRTAEKRARILVCASNVFGFSEFYKVCTYLTAIYECQLQTYGPRERQGERSRLHNELKAEINAACKLASDSARNK